MGTTGQLAAVPEPKYWHLRTVLLRAIDTEFSTGQVLPNERELGPLRRGPRDPAPGPRPAGAGGPAGPPPWHRHPDRRPRVGVPVSRREEGWPGTARTHAWRTVDCTSAPAAASLAQELGIPEGEIVHTVRRVRTVQGQTVATESLHVPSSALPHLPGFRAENDRARSVLRHLERLEVDGESRAVELGVAEADQAALLERPPGTPVLVVTSQYAAGGRLVALAVSTYRADTCKLTFGETGLVEVTPVTAGAAVATAS